MYRIGQKQTLAESIKTLKVLKHILIEIHLNNVPFTTACFLRVPDLEESDTVEEIFTRRMALAEYLQ